MTEVTNSDSASEKISAGPANLRETIRKSREFLCRVVESGKKHSPFSNEKLEAADAAVEGVIHSGYQGVKRVFVNGHPVIILSLSAVAAALPSVPFGPKAVFRNVGLITALTSVMIYPDHLKPYLFRRSTASSSEHE